MRDLSPPVNSNAAEIDLRRFEILAADSKIAAFMRHLDHYKILLLLIRSAPAGFEGVTRLIETIPYRQLTSVSIIKFLNECFEMGLIDKIPGRKRNSFRIIIHPDIAQKYFDVMARSFAAGLAPPEPSKPERAFISDKAV